MDNDTIDLKSPNFNTTQFIAKLLTDVKKRENVFNMLVMKVEQYLRWIYSEREWMWRLNQFSHWGEIQQV